MIVHFYDDQDVSARHGLHLAYGPVEKKGLVDWPRPVWDLVDSSVFAGSIVELPEGGYRLYYSGKVSEGERKYGLAVAESLDGTTWQKPPLGQLEREGSDTNRIVPENMPDSASLTQPQVVRLPDGTWLMWVWWHGKEIGMFRYVRAESSNGIRWRFSDTDVPAVMHPADRELGQNAWVAGLTGASEEDNFADQRTLDFEKAKRLRSNDATYVYYDDEARVFIMYSVWLMPVDESTHRLTPHDNAPQVLRTIHRRESPDSIHWSDPEMLIFADENDPLHQQFYYLACQPDGLWNIGMLGHYRCWEQSMDLELCFSRDTHHWIRPLRGGWVPRGTVSDPDHMAVYAPNRLIDMGSNWRLLYRAGNEKHNRGLPQGVESPIRETMIADVPKGRFAGLATTDRCVGSLTLERVNNTEKEITVDADIRGVLQAELRDPYGRPLPGYELNECIPVQGDSQTHVLKWRGGHTSDVYRYDVLSLRVEIQDGVIYSVRI